jgi:hypothetical protein
MTAEEIVASDELYTPTGGSWQECTKWENPNTYAQKSVGESKPVWETPWPDRFWAGVQEATQARGSWGEDRTWKQDQKRKFKNEADLRTTREHAKAVHSRERKSEDKSSDSKMNTKLREWRQKPKNEEDGTKTKWWKTHNTFKIQKRFFIETQARLQSIHRGHRPLFLI